MWRKREVKVEWWVKLYKCSSCWEFLPRDRFQKNLSWYDFISSECKKCNNERIKKYRQENKDKWNEYQRNYKAKRMLMYEQQFWATPIPEPTYPQPWPQSIPAVQPNGLSAHQSQSDWVWEPYLPQPEPIQTVITLDSKKNDVILTPSINEWDPVITTWKIPEEWFTFSSNFARAEKLRQENLAAAEEEAAQLEDEEVIIQAAIDKNPDAYTEILSDEDLLNAFNNRSVESKINELTRRQQKFDKQKQEKEYNAMKEKMRDLVDATLNDEQKKYFENKLHSLHEEQQDDFVRKVSRLSKASFPVSREAIFDAQLDIQTWKIKNKDVII